MAFQGRWKLTLVAMRLLLVVHACLLAYGAIVHAPAIDEPNHLSAGLKIVRTGNFGSNLGNPPLLDVIAALPVVAGWSDIEIGDDRYLGPYDIKPRSVSVSMVFFASRCAVIPFSVIGGYCVFCWCGALYGRAASVCSLAIWCFLPCVLYFGHTVTGDMAATSCGVIAAFRYWRWLTVCSLFNAVLAGIAMGFAMLTKMMWVILPILWPVVFLCWVLLSKKESRQSPPLLHLFAILAIGAMAINIGYCFEASFFCISDLYEPARPVVDLSVLGGLGGLRIPLPRNYVLGLLDVSSVLSHPHLSYLGGEWKLGGWWYFYLYGLAVKLPLGLQVMILVSAGLSSIQKRNRQRELPLLATGLVVFCFVSWTTHQMSSQYRYILPVYPFLVIYAGKTIHWVFSSLLQRGVAERKNSRAMVAWCILALCAWSIASGISSFPHSMAYFNEIAGGPSRGHRHFCGSSLNWGQDLWLLCKWQRQHCPNEEVRLGYRTAIHPDWGGLSFRAIPQLPGNVYSNEVGESGWSTLSPGWYAISVSMLNGYETVNWTQSGSRPVLFVANGCRYLRHFEPIDCVGPNLLIYHLTRSDITFLKNLYGDRSEE